MCIKRMPVLIVTIFTASAVSNQRTRTHFPCFTDICNVHDLDQFCSEREEKCRNCLEVVGSCFEPELPNNCTRTCVEFHVKKEMKEAKESVCEGFIAIKNGKSNGSLLNVYSPGDVITVTCDSGYRLSGRKTIECKSYGHWSHDLPTCEEITCPVLPSVQNGKHNGSLTIQHKQGDVLTVQCNPGYHRIGPETTRCNSNGVWQNQLSVCQKSACERFVAIKNGKSNGSLLNVYSPGDVITVICDAGYRLSGRKTIECKSYGHWSHDLPTCEEITCPMLPSVQNGKHNGSLTIQHKQGDVLTVQCNPGYHRIGPETTRCNSNGVWQNQLSVCQKFPEVPPIKNGEWERKKSKNGQESDTIHVTCDKGYTLEGDQTFHWPLRGDWNSSDVHIPFCLREEGINVWMVVVISEGAVVIIAFGMFFCCKTYKSHITRSKKGNKYDCPKNTKGDGTKEEMAVMMEPKDEENLRPYIEHVFNNTDTLVSLHDEKLQREASSVSNPYKCKVPEVHPFRSEHTAIPSDQNDSVMSVDLPSSFITTGQKVFHTQNKQQDNTTAREKDNQSSRSTEPSGKNPESGNHVKVNINITSNNSSDNSNKNVVGNGTCDLPAEPACKRSPNTTETKDLKEEELKSPIEESATFQPSHPQTSPDTEDKVPSARHNDQHQNESKVGAKINENSCSSFRPVNGLAVQQSANDEQDTGRKLAMLNGNLNAEDIRNH